MRHAVRTDVESQNQGGPSVNKDELTVPFRDTITQPLIISDLLCGS